MNTSTVLAPTTTRQFIPTTLGNEGWYRAVSVTGISESHELWVSESGCDAIYFVAPQGGPYRYLTAWQSNQHTAQAWYFPVGAGQSHVDRYALQMAAENYVIAQARASVIAEMEA